MPSIHSLSSAHTDIRKPEPAQLKIMHKPAPPVHDPLRTTSPESECARRHASMIGANTSLHLHPESEERRQKTLATLESDYAHFLNLFNKNEQPAGNGSSLRQRRSLGPILAMLNVLHGMNLTYCDGVSEFDAWMNEVSKKAGDWQGGALVLWGNPFTAFHYGAVTVIKRDVSLFVEGRDSVAPGEMHFKVAFGNFKTIMAKYENASARYGAVPVQSTTLDCAFHSIYFLMTQRKVINNYVERACRASQPRQSVELASVMGDLRPHHLLHVDTESRLRNLSSFQRASILDKERVGEEFISLQRYHQAHLTTKRVESTNDSHTYSDSAECYRLALFEDAVGWLKHAGAVQACDALDKARANRQIAAADAADVVLLSTEMQTESFRHVLRDAGREAAKFWDRDMHLKFTTLPIRPTATWPPR